ncbi:MAG: site-2 protease family protein, partial [Halanaerobiaceae bacterium]
LALVLTAVGYILNYRALIWPEMMIKFNIMLGCFNLLPALPLDGGRVLRSILVSRMGLKTGTMIAIKIARYLAITGIVAGFVALFMQKSNLWILLVSFFVYGAVIKESQGIIYRLTFYLTHRKEYLQKKDFRPVIIRVIKENVRVREVVHYLLPVYFNIFLILDDNLRTRAEITEVELVEAFFSFPDKNMTLNDIIDKGIY